MAIEHIVMIVVPIITGAFGYLGHKVNIGGKSEETSLKRVEFIMSSMERLNKECESRVARLAEENSKLRGKVRYYKTALEQVAKKGGE